MKLSTALNIMLSSFTYAAVTSKATSIQEKVGSGCQNNVQFSSKFMTDSGEECNTCVLCDGSHWSDIFKPKSKGVCVDCSAVEDTCNNFMITTTFDSKWLMQFVSLAPSGMPSESDPKAVLIEASNDSATWVEMYNVEDNMLFKTRAEPTEFLLHDYDTEFKHYRITFKPKDNMSKYYIGHYGLVPSYTKTCTSNIYQAITGKYIRPYATLAPTEAPTSSPTTAPTDAPGFEMTNLNIKTAVNLWTSDRNSALATYGHISAWDVSKVTSMTSLFSNKSTFNDDISGWEVGSVIAMNEMFSNAKAFNQNLSTWDTSNVETMANMFPGATLFNGDLSKWNTNKVTAMNGMFVNAKSFNCNVSAWNINKVTTMNVMFFRASVFQQALCWDVEGIITSNMFFESPGSVHYPCN